MEKLGFPWILSSESSLFNGLQGKFGGVIVIGVPRRGGRFLVERLEIVDEAIDLANDSDFGLQGAVFTKSLETAFRFARDGSCQ